MKKSMATKALIMLMLSFGFVGSMNALTRPANAAVVNCTTYTTTWGGQLMCAGTNGNPPYTTQYRAWIWCRIDNATTSYRAQGEWENAGSNQWSIASCFTGGGKRVSPVYKEYR